MAFNAAPPVNAGPELAEITTDAVGFNTLAGEVKVQLLSEPWPTENPPPYASLFAVASIKGLVAAASPSSLVLTSSESVREAFYADAQSKNKIKPFTPQVTLSVPRVSHVAFSSDESSLVIAAQAGGGLAVYDLQAVMGGKKESTFQLATNGTSVRALAPNPAPESAHLFAVVLTNGQLLIADLKQGQLINTPNGSVFREGVSCVSWSSRGKQLVAGLEDGSAVQYDPQGNVKAQIPRPPQLDQQLPVTCIYWIANDDFLVIHTPVNTDVTDSTYHIMHREKASGSFTVQKFSEMADPCPGFGTRVPAQHFVSRLKKFPPHLDELLILSSTASSDVGMVTKSTAPLAPETPIVNAFALTTMEVDSRRATLPMSVSEDMSGGDPSVIGMDLDLSAKNPVPRPIPQEEIEESSTPLPALMVLNDEGILSAWWVVYNESVRQKTAYPGLGGVVAPTPSNIPATASFQSPANTSASNSFAKPAQPAFGSPSLSFGNSSLGAKSSPWSVPSTGTSQNAASAPGANSAPFTGTFQNASASPAFGSPSLLGSKSGNSGFGSVGGMGNKASPWGSPTSAAAKPAFAQTSVPFGGSAASGPSGFAALAGAKTENKPSTSFSFGNNSSSTSPFAQVGGGNNNTQSFGSFGDGKLKKSSPLAFGQSSESVTPSAQPSSQSKEESMNDDTTEDSTTEKKPSEPTKPETKTLEKQPQKSEQAKSPFSFGQPSDKAQSPFAQAAKSTASPFAQTPAGTGTSPFAQLGKPQTSPFAKVSSPGSTPSIFSQTTKSTGFQFGKASSRSASPLRQSSDQPPSKLPTLGGFKLGSTFQGDGSAKDDVKTTKKDGASSFNSMFGDILGDTTKEKAPEQAIKKEPGTEEPKLQDISDSPAPPSKQGSAKDASKTTDETAEPEEAPLPPDFTTAKPKETEEEDIPPIAGSPPVDLAEDAVQLSPPASDDGSWEEEDVSEEESEEEDEDEDQEEGEADENEGEVNEEYEEYDEEDEDEEEEEDHTVDNTKATNTSFFPSHSTTPAGLPKGPLFAPPSKTQDSPRSPSPVRPGNTAPVARPTSRQTAQTVSVPSLKPQTRPASLQRPVSPPEPEAGELSDDEDVRVRELLASEVEPTKELEPFIAHQDYVGQSDKEGLGVQIENVYRDINSMIDTLGLNARAMEAFVKGHETQYKASGRERSDLEDADDWCLIETRDLEVVEKEIGADLDNGRVEDVEKKLNELMDLQKDANRLRTKTSEMRKQIGARADPQQRADHRASSLNNEAQMQQNELREGVAQVQKLLQGAEEALSVLRANLASVSTRTDAQAGQRVPTVEAVTRTILKMTAMIEQKSGDVDMLEMQLRRLPRGLEGLSLGGSNDDLRSSVRSIRALDRTSSPFGTPPATRGKDARNNATPMGMSGMFGRFGGSVRRDREEFGRSSMMMEGTPRKKMADVSTEEVKRYQDKVNQRKGLLAALKQTIEKKGNRVTAVQKK